MSEAEREIVDRANRYQAYVRGWKHGATAAARDNVSLARCPDPSVVAEYDHGYNDGAGVRAIVVRRGQPAPRLRPGRPPKYGERMSTNIFTGLQRLNATTIMKAAIARGLEELRTDLAKLDGTPPFDGPENPCRGDAYFAQSLEAKYNANLELLRKAAKEDVPK